MGFSNQTNSNPHFWTGIFNGHRWHQKGPGWTRLTSSHGVRQGAGRPGTWIAVAPSDPAALVAGRFCILAIGMVPHWWQPPPDFVAEKILAGDLVEVLNSHSSNHKCEVTLFKQQTWEFLIELAQQNGNQTTKNWNLINNLGAVTSEATTEVQFALGRTPAHCSRCLPQWYRLHSSCPKWWPNIHGLKFVPCGAPVC